MSHIRSLVRLELSYLYKFVSFIYASFGSTTFGDVQCSISKNVHGNWPKFDAVYDVVSPNYINWLEPSVFVARKPLMGCCFLRKWLFCTTRLGGDTQSASYTCPSCDAIHEYALIFLPNGLDFQIQIIIIRTILIENRSFNHTPLMCALFLLIADRMI